MCRGKLVNVYDYGISANVLRFSLCGPHVAAITCQTLGHIGCSMPQGNTATLLRHASCVAEFRGCIDRGRGKTEERRWLKCSGREAHYGCRRLLCGCLRLPTISSDSAAS